MRIKIGEYYINIQLDCNVLCLIYIYLLCISFITIIYTWKGRKINVVPPKRNHPHQMVGLWCLMPLSTIFQLYRGCQFYWWRKSEYLQKTMDLPQVTDKISHTVVSSTHRLSEIRTRTTLVVIGTNCIGSYKSNYHMIMTMTAPVNQ